ncbi:unnamed protein product, partial [Ectocarpus fasciculatus]
MRAGTTLWDAEVVLSHVLESDGVRGSVIELGAGSGLAAMVCSRLGCSVTAQELSEVLPHTKAVFSRNNVAATFVSATWGCDFIEQVYNLRPFDNIIMSDVLYHCADFDDLISSIRSCSTIGTKIYVSFEQRRKNLDDFFDKLQKCFS